MISPATKRRVWRRWNLTVLGVPVRIGDAVTQFGEVIRRQGVSDRISPAVAARLAELAAEAS